MHVDIEKMSRFSINNSLFLISFSQEEAPVSHIVTVDENGRPHQLQEITTGWRWLQQSAGGLFVASTRSDPAAPMILASQSTDQSTNSLPTRLVSKVDANERDVMFKQIDRERKEVSRQVSKEVGDGILLQQDHNHQHQHYAISKQDQENVLFSSRLRCF